MKLLTLLFVFSVPSFVQAAPCKFDFDTNSSKVAWTAFKTTQKTPVGGSFTSVTYTGADKNQKAVSELIKGMTAKIALRDAASSTSGNPARDQTLFDHFFSKFKNTAFIEGKVKSVKGDAEAGDLQLEIRMNEKTKSVSAHYTVDKDGHFEAKTEFDILDFALSGPLSDLSKACEALHKGTDGVSKTWSTVEVKWNATVTQKCSS